MYPIQPIMPPMMKEEFLYQESFHKKNSDSMFLGKSAEHIVASYLKKTKLILLNLKLIKEMIGGLRIQIIENKSAEHK